MAGRGAARPGADGRRPIRRGRRLPLRQTGRPLGDRFPRRPDDAFVDTEIAVGDIEGLQGTPRPN